MGDLSFVVTFGPGPLAAQAKYLIRSIRRLYENESVFTFVTKEQRDLISPSILSELDRHSTLIVGKAPIAAYPLSAKMEALRVARNISDANAVMLLDADTLIIQEPAADFDSGADLYVKPVNAAGKGLRRDLWETVYDALGKKVPTARVTSTVDNREVFPYYNAGVVVTTADQFPKRWVEAAKSIHDALNQPDRFVDQLALGAIASEYIVHHLDERDNFPLAARIRVPQSVRILHYYHLHQLSRVRNPAVLSLIRALDMGDSVYETHRPRFYWNVLRNLWKAAAFRIKYGPGNAAGQSQE